MLLEIKNPGGKYCVSDGLSNKYENIWFQVWQLQLTCVMLDLSVWVAPTHRSPRMEWLAMNVSLATTVRKVQIKESNVRQEPSAMPLVWRTWLSVRTAHLACTVMLRVSLTFHNFDFYNSRVHVFWSIFVVILKSMILNVNKIYILFCILICISKTQIIQHNWPSRTITNIQYFIPKCFYLS